MCHVEEIKAVWGEGSLFILVIQWSWNLGACPVEEVDSCWTRAQQMLSNTRLRPISTAGSSILCPRSSIRCSSSETTVVLVLPEQIFLFVFSSSSCFEFDMTDISSSLSERHSCLCGVCITERAVVILSLISSHCFPCFYLLMLPEHILVSSLD